MKVNADSFSLFYKKYQERFLYFANAYVRDMTTAEDITLEALIYYWENRREIDNETNVLAYILTVIKHKCLNYLRHQQVCEDYSEVMKDYYEWELGTRISSLQACEPHELFVKEIEELVQQTLAQLPDKTRQIFQMNRYDNKSYKEIAVIMNMTVKGVDFHICKALKALQENLKDYFPFFLYFFYQSH